MPLPHAVTIPAVTTASLDSAAAPKRVEPQLLEHPHAAVHVAVAADKDGSPVSISAVVPARVRISVGRSSLIGWAVPAFISASTMATIWRSTAFELPLENVADLDIGVAGGITGRHHRVVVRVDGGGTADHPLGELLGRLARLTRERNTG